MGMLLRHPCREAGQPKLSTQLQAGLWQIYRTRTAPVAAPDLSGASRPAPAWCPTALHRRAGSGVVTHVALSSAMAGLMHECLAWSYCLREPPTRQGLVTLSN